VNGISIAVAVVVPPDGYSDVTASAMPQNSSFLMERAGCHRQKLENCVLKSLGTICSPFHRRHVSEGNMWGEIPMLQFSRENDNIDTGRKIRSFCGTASFLTEGTP